MEIEYRKLVDTDLDTFISMRIAQLREEGAKEDIDLAPALRDYYTRHMADGTFISWLAVSEGKIVGTSGMSIVEKPPYFGCPSGKDRAAFEYVHRQRIPQERHSKGAAHQSCGRGKKGRMRNSTDNSL